MTDDFYRVFEDRYRGTRELIKSRLQAYLPFIEPVCKLYPAAPALDLGCGRGEWLEVLASAGFTPTGVDLDEGMLSACNALGLATTQGDAIAYLAALPDESQAVVSAFHVVEHIGFDEVKRLVCEALRVLKPGGLLIMETPNTENIVVATRIFFLDPTHLRPIPAELLSFVPEYYGFKRVKTIRLQEPAYLVGRETISLHELFHGVSPDYAVVAQKEADPAVMAATAPAFEREYGLSLESLSATYDNAVQLKVQMAEGHAQQAELKAQQTQAHGQQAELKARQAEAHGQQAELKAQQAEAHGQQAELKARQAEAHAQQAELKARQAEAHAQQAGLRAQQAEAHAQQAVHWMQKQKEAELERRAVAAESQAAAQEHRAIVAEQSLQQCQQQAEQWHQRILLIHASASWKITKPLRAFRRLLTGDFSVFDRPYASVKRKAKETLRPVASAGIAYARKRPALRNRLKRLVMRFPKLAQRLRRVAATNASLANLSAPVTDSQGDVKASGASVPFQGERLQGTAPDIDAILDRIRIALEKGSAK